MQTVHEIVLVTLQNDFKKTLKFNLLTEQISLRFFRHIAVSYRFMIVNSQVMQLSNLDRLNLFEMQSFNDTIVDINTWFQCKLIFSVFFIKKKISKAPANG